MSTCTLSGPLFESADSTFWHSVHGKPGGHYNTFACKPEHGMKALRHLFPDGVADEANFVLFSTSGVHGTYCTIERVEAEIATYVCHPEDRMTEVTFLIVQPRIVCCRYGNCTPETKEDFEFLKQLRETSWAAVLAIGKGE